MPEDSARSSSAQAPCSRETPARPAERLRSSRSSVLAIAALIGAPWITSCSQPELPGPRTASSELVTHFGSLEGVCVLQRIDAQERPLVVGSLDPETRVAPCSTFKVPHALIGLTTGVIEGADDVIAWDGTDQPFRSWKRDHTLRTAVQNSVLWYFQDVARRVRPERMKAHLEAFDYGTGSIDAHPRSFWLTNDGLRISPNEQVAFLERLYGDRLPVLRETTALVRDLIVLERRGDDTFSGKTGSAWPQRDGMTIGWFVGHVRQDEREYVFATLVRARENAFGKQAREITESLLDELGLWRRETYASP